MTKEIESLIDKVGAERTFFDGELLGAFFTMTKLEAFAKALQQPSEPVGEVCVYPMGVSNGVNMWMKTALPTGNYELYTQPPNTVSLEQYNKLLGALKHSRMTLELANLNKLITDTIWASKSETLFDFMDNAIAEAERSAK